MMMSNKNILICDRYNDMIGIIAETIKPFNFNILGTDNGRIALNILLNEHIDIVITSLKLLEVSGVGLIHTAIDNLIIPKESIIICSGSPRVDEYAKLLEVDKWMSKPVNEIELLSNIHAIINNQKYRRLGYESYKFNITSITSSH